MYKFVYVKIQRTTSLLETSSVFLVIPFFIHIVSHKKNNNTDTSFWEVTNMDPPEYSKTAETNGDWTIVSRKKTFTPTISAREIRSMEENEERDSTLIRDFAKAHDYYVDNNAVMLCEQNAGTSSYNMGTSPFRSHGCRVTGSFGFLLFDESDNLIGFAICCCIMIPVKPDEDREEVSEIVSFFIRPDYRKHHIGRYLFELCKSKSKANTRIMLVRLQGKEESSAGFWVKMGFEESKEIYHGENGPKTTLLKTI